MSCPTCFGTGEINQDGCPACAQRAEALFRDMRPGAVLATSYAVALSECRAFEADGQSPRKATEDVGYFWTQRKEPTWDDAVCIRASAARVQAAALMPKRAAR